MVNETLVKYLAGLLDADGSLSFSFAPDHNREGLYFLRLALKLTAADAVDKHGFVASLPSLTGMGAVCREGKDKQFAVWSVYKRADLEMLIPRLVKHMVIKAKHWQWLLDMWRTLRQDGATVSESQRKQLTEMSKESRRSNSGPLKPKNHPAWAWLAGYLDGDGTYHYRSYQNKSYTQWTMNVSAVAHVNDICVLEFLKNAFGGRIQDQGQSDNVKVWMRSIGYQNRSFALRFLPNVAKHSRLKREKIDQIIYHHQQRLTVPGTDKTYCTIEGCERPNRGRGLCGMHYQRQYRCK